MTNDHDGDAHGGRRGRRARTSAELFEFVRQTYGIEVSAEHARDLGGSSNLNLLLGDRWVVRVYRPYVKPDRVAAMSAVRELLARGSIPCAPTRLTLAGEPWTVFGDRCVEIERYVACDAKMHDWDRVEAALPTLGRMHAWLIGVDLGAAANEPEFANYIDPREVVLWATKASERIRSWNPAAAPPGVAGQLHEVAESLAEAELRVGVRELPHQLTHGDFWDNNVFFKDDRLALVTDFDFMGARARIDDLALTFFFAGYDLSSAHTPADLFERLPRLLAAYERGLGKRLTEAERAALPLAIARQPLFGARWLAILDNESAARRLADALPRELAWANTILQDLGPWDERTMKPLRG
jgi:homoserine kinase type II